MWLLLPDTLARSLTLVSRQTKLTFSPFAGTAHLRHTPDDAASGAANTTNRVGASITFSLMRSLCHVATSESFYIWFVSFYLLNFNVTPKPMGTGMPVLSST